MVTPGVSWIWFGPTRTLPGLAARLARTCRSDAASGVVDAACAAPAPASDSASATESDFTVDETRDIEGSFLFD